MSRNNDLVNNEQILSDDDDYRSLTRIAARCIYSKNYEEEGIKEIINLTKTIENSIKWQYFVYISLLTCCITISVIIFVFWITFLTTKFRVGEKPVIISFLMALIAMGLNVYWRNQQYKIKFFVGDIAAPRSAIYGHANKSTVESLEKLFTYLGRRTAPKAYYRTRHGRKRYVSHYYFWGSLRGLLLSDNAGSRSMISPPFGFWFSSEIKIEAEPEAIIAALKIKPKAGGRPKEIDYEAIALMLIEHPALRDIQPNRHGHETRLMDLIVNICESPNGLAEGIRAPEQTQLRSFAKKILASIEKNRASAN